ncbi:MAG: PhnX-like: phosphonatase-like hydrolase [Firmicutes bacterium]|nr:PhnX-like: phosphonatase-like hydrolase [Bacillota bacterium]
MNILFWDIDGTLIRTSGAGLYAFEQATSQLWNRSVDFSTVRSAGMTDHSIAAQIVEAVVGRQPLHEEIITLTDRYETLLPQHLAKRACRILPSIFETLNHFRHQDDYKTLLLTGNSRIGSEIKLQHLGLAQYFDFSYSAFCDHRSSRIEIARSALQAAEALCPLQQAANLFVIGDTPHDIQCGQAIGAYTVAVATGSFSVEQLNGYSPWWALDELPTPEQFQAKIEETAKQKKIIGANSI